MLKFAMYTASVSSKGMDVFVRDSQGGITAIEVESDATVGHLRDQAAIQARLTPYEKLSFAGKVLDEKLPLADAGVAAEVILDVVKVALSSSCPYIRIGRVRPCSIHGLVSIIPAESHESLLV